MVRRDRLVILLADNHLGLLRVYSRVLQQAGYEVVMAGTIEEAENVLRQNRVHLAILDIRMQDEVDADDVSGLQLAQREEYRAVPKIIWTAYCTVELVRQALGSGPGEPPPAVGFVGKEEGPEALVEAVRLAFERHPRH